MLKVNQIFIATILVIFLSMCPERVFAICRLLNRTITTAAAQTTTSGPAILSTTSTNRPATIPQTSTMNVPSTSSTTNSPSTGSQKTSTPTNRPIPTFFNSTYSPPSCICSTTSLISTPSTVNFNYCSLSSSNILCILNSTSLDPSCKLQNYKVLSPSLQDQDTIVGLHNFYRRAVAYGLETNLNGFTLPPAANMMKMRWDQGLAAMAQASVQLCEGTSYYDYSTQKFPSNVMQWDGYLTPSTGANFTNYNWFNQVTSWHDVATLDPRNINNYGTVLNGNYGRYTLMIWATTTSIGCGAMGFYVGRLGGYYIYYNCLYAPGGNAYGQPIYTIGTGASACPPGTQPTEGLCA